MNALVSSIGIDSRTGTLAWIAVLIALVCLGLGGLRWLRVAQREHYLFGSCTRFMVRWYKSGWGNTLLGVFALWGLVLSIYWPVGAIMTGIAVGVGPFGLSLRGRTSRLVWTRRLRALSGVWLGLELLVLVIGILLGFPAVFGAISALLIPVLMDFADAILAPVEKKLGARFVKKASRRLAEVKPTVVAITGSYGKTSVKGHLFHLLSEVTGVVASPASFNNRAGLARSINENLVAGTEVFIAEMGTYAVGEIAELCEWVPPDISVITAIGPVHLERFGSEDRILLAKSEIVTRACTVVLNIDDPRLRRLADDLECGSRDPHGAKEVVRCSALDRSADVCVIRENTQSNDVSVWCSSQLIAHSVTVAGSLQPINLACALGVAFRLGLSTSSVESTIASIPVVSNRASLILSESGVVIIDDTFNSNPAGARAGLEILKRSIPNTEILHRRVVVTPGMVELGKRQFEENRAFGQDAAEIATDFIIVGRTNRAALLDGAKACNPVCVRDRSEAVEWVRKHLNAGDGVLYENDLPDHYP